MRTQDSAARYGAEGLADLASDDDREAVAAAHLADLERLIAGYRERCSRLVRRLRTRQRGDLGPTPMPQSLVDQRLREDVDIDRFYLHDAWALNVITGGECCAESGPPADWRGLGLAAGLLHGQAAAHGGGA